MLEVQKYLAEHSLLGLSAEKAIKVKEHPTLPLVILNYDQIASVKSDPIVRECRGLVLEKHTWALVARSFPRFFNWGEMADEMPLFNFSDCCAHTKEDGSLVLLYFYNGKWMANTRGSFADQPMEFQNFTWEEGICRALGVPNLQELPWQLQPELCYVCEFVSPWNKVVRNYKEPAMYLLTVFRGERELTSTVCDMVTRKCFKRPKQFNFHDIEEVQAYLEMRAKADPTYEGVVLRDRDNRRWKVKNPKYLALHHLKGEGSFHPEHLLPFVLKGERDEVLVYFEEATAAYEQVEQKVNEAYAQLSAVWEASRAIKDQKEFAQAIIGKTPFTSILFNVRKYNITDLDTAWRNSGQRILNILFK